MEKSPLFFAFFNKFSTQNQHILWKTLPEEAADNMHTCAGEPQKKAESNADQEQSPNLHHFRHGNDHYSVYLNRSKWWIGALVVLLFRTTGTARHALVVLMRCNNQLLTTHHLPK